MLRSEKRKQSRAIILRACTFSFQVFNVQKAAIFSDRGAGRGHIRGEYLPYAYVPHCCGTESYINPKSSGPTRSCDRPSLSW
jgi:hypothetical protein